MYAVRFRQLDPQPVEEYFYQKKEDAMYHFNLFRDDDSGLYSQIDLLDLPEKDLDQEKILDCIAF